MNDLIEALQIFAKYGNPHNPTHCEHDELFVMIDPSIVSDIDLKRLEELSFRANDGLFTSYRFGSA